MARRPKAEFDITARDKARATLVGVDRTLGNLARTAAFGGRALGGLAGAAGLAQLAELSDQYNALNIRIRTATKETGDYNIVQKELISLSAQTGAGLADTVDTFQALGRVREDIGATNTQMLGLTRTVQQLGVIGGSSTEAMRFGLRQFNQAIAAGTFRAEEFNSIVENLPELALRIADGFNKTTGELRQMVLDGELLSEDVINVLLKAAPEIADEFEEIPLTLDRAFASLKDSMGAALSTVDQTTGLTGGLAQVIANIARELRLISGNASPIEQLQQQQIDLQRQIDETSQRLAGLGSTEKGRNSELFADLEAQLDALKARAEGTKEAIEFFQNPELGQVGTEDKIEPISGDALNKSLRRAEQHFAKLLKIEDDYLQQQRDLRLRGNIELAEAIAAEEELMRADELARLAGFEDQKALLRFEKEQENHNALLEGRQLRFEEELAQLLGFEDAKAQAIAAQDDEFKRRRIEAQFAGNNLAKKAALDLLKFEKGTAVEKSRFILGTAASMTQGLAANSRAFFNINKAAGIANAVINTAEGVTAALKMGPWGIPLAALIAAQGAAQVATIASTQFGGGSSGATGFGPGTGIPSLADQGPPRDLPSISADDRNETQIVLVIQGGDSVARAVAENIRVQIDEGDELLLGSNSRQSIEIREGPAG